MIRLSRFGVCSVLVAAGLSLLSAPRAYAYDGWVSVAASPSRESLDWGFGPDKQAAESSALAQCAELQHASNCVVLASSPGCVAVAWDDSQPLNRPYAAASSSSKIATQSALSAAGPAANDPSVRCTWS
jgi:hypothetical protein